jgi:hypothetical protein
MKFTKIPLLILSICLFASAAAAQKTEITISFGEQFFDALLDAVFQYAPPPEFILTKNSSSSSSKASVAGNSFASVPECSETVRLLRETNGKRSSVRFREGRITAPIAFSGNYNPPFIGCVPFAGIAETIVDLEFDEQNQRLLARVRVNEVNLNGMGGIGSGMVARMVQGSIDRKINPIEVVKTDKVTFDLPLQSSGSVRMRAIGFSHQIVNGQLVIHISYNFEKGR